MEKRAVVEEGLTPYEGAKPKDIDELAEGCVPSKLAKQAEHKPTYPRCNNAQLLDRIDLKQ